VDADTGPYEVVTGPRKGKRFVDLGEAERHALARVREVVPPPVVPIYDAGGVVIAVAVDDAEGVQLHKLPGYPAPPPPPRPAAAKKSK
jgi:hypothetical protein